MARQIGFRVCSKCGEKINIKQVGTYVKVNASFYHIDCYRDKELNKKKGRLTQEEIEINIQKYLDLTEKQFRPQIDREKLEAWLTSNYGIVYWDNWICTKITEIINGTYRGLNEPISAEDLLYMFKKMKNKLDVIADNKEAKGEHFKDNKARLSYDLVIIINKYESYKKWKERQKDSEIKEQQNKESYKEMNEYKKIYQKHVRQAIVEENDDEIDINSIVDEI